MHGNVRIQQLAEPCRRLAFQASDAFALFAVQVKCLGKETRVEGMPLA
jgi:hypothetical protein